VDGRLSTGKWAGAKYTKSGIPDILACVDGQFIAIEDKAKNGKPTLLQLVNLKKIRFSFGFGILLYPDDFENFKRFVLEMFENDDLTEWQSKWYNKNIMLQREWMKKLENA
jgi:hypothetical protein